MGMNLARTGVAGALGIGSGVLDPASGVVQPLMLGTTSVSYAAILEALGLVGGGILQFAMPYTMPDVADGLVDGGIALLAARGTKYAVAKMRPTTAGAAAAYLGAQRVGALASGNGYGALTGAPLYSRGQVGGMAGVSKRTLT